MNGLIRLEDAIKAINDAPCHSESIRAIFRCAISALEQQPCEDAISREDALMCLTGMFRLPLNYNPEDLIALFSKRIKALPSVTQKSGVWVEIDDEPHEVWECDHCGFVIDGSGCIEPYEYRDTYKYCPNCGVCMKDGRTLDEFIEDSKESEDKE